MQGRNASNRLHTGVKETGNPSCFPLFSQVGISFLPEVMAYSSSWLHLVLMVTEILETQWLILYIRFIIFLHIITIMYLIYMWNQFMQH